MYETFISTIFLPQPRMSTQLPAEQVQYLERIFEESTKNIEFRKLLAEDANRAMDQAQKQLGFNYSALSSEARAAIESLTSEEIEMLASINQKKINAGVPRDIEVCPWFY